MGEISEHLLKRRFKARKPNEKWLTDVTELKGKDGKLYLSPILDLFNREIVAYAMSRRADSEMVKEMLEKAAPRLTDKGTMLHSDQGVLYRTAGIGNCLRSIPWFKACRERRTVGTMRRWKASLRC
ncbi:DDE-type integrase/transposase/recombinase [Neisseria sp. GT4A_CT1]|uniref:DDE-type integrase/transposase/recombinase n=1 Tax=Neisseria sp. GT4A_CT1 TaxID=665946 RepID=UPI00022BFB77|nr:DDE-type integrase/transposase/recombinase [Neisseria sp. GT4A_CT1]EGY63121.1 hypothetical protein HMPREF1028_02542 [Neisseria sp. GT4A_CT1]